MGHTLVFIVYWMFLIAWFLIIALYLLEWTYIVQLKEYRTDRILDYFKSKKGRSFFTRYLSLAIFSIGIVGLVFLVELDIVLVMWIILLLLGAVYFVKKYGLFRPVWTKKSIAIYLFSLIWYITFFCWFLPRSLMILFSIFHLILPLILLFITQLFQIPTFFAKRYYIAKATKNLATYTNLKVIGITGSYGKTSTRNYLVQILSSKNKVVTTPKNINTEIGVAKFILGHDFSDDDIFVVEMGAYRKGEIKLIADMIRPQIGIITTIGPEHLALFGSMENIRDAKGELFAALPKGGLAITNADNAYCRTYIDTYKHVNIQTFGTTDVQHPTILISSVKQTKDGIEATLNYEGKDIELSAPLYGTHNAANIAAALLAVEKVGMKVDDIIESTKTLSAPPHRLNRVERGNNVVVLDDTYNSNPEGFLEALDILAMQEQEKKVVITRGMLELGTAETQEHIRVGKRIGEVADTAIIISPDNAAHIQTGIEQSGKKVEIITDYNMTSVAARYHAIIESGNVAILLENRVPERILKDLEQ